MPYYQNNPNQKKIRIQKETCDLSHRFTTINLATMKDAMNNLTNAQFKVWIYLAKNADGFELQLSPAEAEGNWNIPRSTMQETIRQFIKMGYIEKIGEDELYVFHEIPVKSK